MKTTLQFSGQVGCAVCFILVISPLGLIWLVYNLLLVAKGD